MGVVVELCGLPGVGKTFVAARTVAALRREGLRASDATAGIGPSASTFGRVARKASRAAAELARADRAELRAQAAVARSQRDARDRLARPVNLLVARDALRRAAARPGYHVIDQGLAQEWWSASLRADRARVLAVMRASLRRSPLPDVLVHVEAPIEVVAGRLAARPGRQSRIEGQSAARLVAELEDGDALLRRVVREIVGRPGECRPVLLVLDGSDPKAASTIVEALRPAVAGSRRSGLGPAGGAVRLVP